MTTVSSLRSFRLGPLFLAAFLVLASDVIAQPVSQPFTFNISTHELPAVRNGAVAWGDIDGDGDLDVFLSGVTDAGAVTQLYRNDGEGSNGAFQFTPVTADIRSTVYSSATFADMDGDGDLDLLVSGSETIDFPYAASSRLYRNDGGTFAEIESTGLPGLHSGSSSWGDIDNDGDLDIVMTGVDGSERLTTAVALNQGGGSFSVETDVIPGIGYGDVELGDIDGDLDLDIVMAGASDAGFMTQVYRNDGGAFNALNSGFTGVAFASVDLGDMDGDGDLDLVVSGGRVSELIFEGGLEIWENSGGTFSRSSDSPAGVLAGDVTWGDYDNDGDLDLLVMGAEAALGRRAARLLRNDDSGFVSASLLVGAMFSDAEWGDLEGDGDLDLLSTGRSTLGPDITNLYENQRQVIPPAPAAPNGLITDVTDGRVLLSWQAPAPTADANTQVTYNVRVGTSPGAGDVVPAMAVSESGQRLVSQPGNAASALNYALDTLEDGTYFWSVQTLNHAFAPSSFATEGQFTISGGLSVDTEDDALLPQRFAVYPNYPNPFSQRTTLRFDLPETSDVSIRIYTLLGQEVVSTDLGTLTAGQHQSDWNGLSASGTQMGSGIYFYEVRAGRQSSTGTMTLVR